MLQIDFHDSTVANMLVKGEVEKELFGIMIGTWPLNQIASRVLRSLIQSLIIQMYRCHLFPLSYWSYSVAIQ